MPRARLQILFFILLVPTSANVFSATSESRMKVDKEHVNAWNQFSDQLQALHKRQMAGKQIKLTQVSGGYASDPDFYNEVTYIDKATGKVLSIIQWEKESPDVVHSIEVFVRDNAGRVIRDYSASYLPGARNAPVQTLINLHNYNGGLHAFRQFDVSEDVIYEYCQGEFEGQQHELRLFEDNLAATDYESRQVLKSPLYKACFKGLQTHVGKYIKPQ